MFARPSRRTFAFTLVELLSVIAVIAILAGLTVGLIRSTRQRAFTARAKAELAVLAHALEEYKRHYGDYPQTGPSAPNSQRVSGASGPGLNSAQAILFNALIGVYGPSGIQGGRLNGPVLVDLSKFTLENQGALNLNTLAVAAGTPPAKLAVNTAFLDPWGNRYLYHYRRAAPAGRPLPPWNAPAFLLYSAGADGNATAQPAADGLFSGTTQTAGDNADNLYADKLL